MCYDIVGSVKLILENNLVKSGFATLLGAFVGAWAAFLFEKYKKLAASKILL